MPTFSIFAYALKSCCSAGAAAGAAAAAATAAAGATPPLAKKAAMASSDTPPPRIFCVTTGSGMPTFSIFAYALRSGASLPSAPLAASAGFAASASSTAAGVAASLSAPPPPPRARFASIAISAAFLFLAGTGAGAGAPPGLARFASIAISAEFLPPPPPPAEADADAEFEDADVVEADVEVGTSADGICFSIHSRFAFCRHSVRASASAWSASLRPALSFLVSSRTWAEQCVADTRCAACTSGTSSGNCHSALRCAQPCSGWPNSAG